MSEAIDNTPTPADVTPQADATTPAEPSNLPSDNGELNLDGFTITDEMKAKFKDGKLNGRFETLEDVLTTLKSAEDKYANKVRELTDAEKATQTDIQKTQEQLQTEQKRTQTITELVQPFIDNGMQLTEEMTAKLTEVGLTEAEIKLGAYEMKDTLASHHKILGGEENYMQVMNYHAQNMSDEQKIAFNADIQSGKHSEALLLGLQTMYEKSGGQAPNSEPQDRFRGEGPNNTSAKGYGTKAELFKDKAYIDSPAGRKDAGAVAKYRAKLAITDPKVYS